MNAMEDLDIVPMMAADIDAVVEIENRSSPTPWPAQLFLEDLGRDWAHIDLVRLVRRTPPDGHDGGHDDGHGDGGGGGHGDGGGGGHGPVMGFASYWLVHDELHLLNLAAHPDHRRRGIGTRLMRHLIAVARGRNCRYVTLEVRRGNHPAQALYQRHGFEAMGLRARYYSDGEDAIVMTLTMDGHASDQARF
jgi:ribosomal-protein-alanine N-acetyltransferase